MIKTPCLNNASPPFFSLIDFSLKNQTAKNDLNTPMPLSQKMPRNESHCKQNRHIQIIFDRCLKHKLRKNEINNIILFTRRFDQNLLTKMPPDEFGSQHISIKKAQELSGIRLPLSLTKEESGKWILHLKTKYGAFIGNGVAKKAKTSMELEEGKILVSLTSRQTDPRDPILSRESLSREAQIAREAYKKRGLAGIRSASSYIGKRGYHKISMIMDYYEEGDLFDRIKGSQTKLTPLEERKVVNDLIEGLFSMKKMGIVHLDIKLENVLLKREKEISAAFADFGFARKVGDDLICAGTPHYMDPNLFIDDLREISPYREKIDIYSFGILITAMLTKIPGPIFSNDSRFVMNYKRKLVKNNDIDEQKERLTSYHRNCNRIFRMYLKSQLNKENYFGKKWRIELLYLGLSCLDLNLKSRPTLEDFQEKYLDIEKKYLKIKKEAPHNACYSLE